MATITEDYVSFETAKLLKEKGFNWGCYQYYNFNDGNLPTMLSFKRQNGDIELDEHPTAPTLQMAMKWLREVYGLHVWVDYSRFDFNKEHPYLWNIAETKIDGDYWGGSYHKHPEEAVEEAIKYCLENLI